MGEADGIVYLGSCFEAAQAGTWSMHLGHDGGVRVFVDGRDVVTVPQLRNPSQPGRSTVEVELSAGRHEVVIALDTADGRGWGIFFSWGVPQGQRKALGKPVFPVPCK